MANRTKTVLDSDQKLRELKKRFDEQANSLGLLDDYIFVTQYRAYADQLSLMDELRQDVTTNGAMSDGKVNPAVSEYNKMASLANKTAGTLLNLFAKATEKKEAAAKKSAADDQRKAFFDL